MEIMSIQRYAYRKFLPSVVIQFFLILSYLCLQDIKARSLIETGLHDTLFSAYLWGGLPLSILFVVAYFKVTNVLERCHHLSFFLIPFGVFFLLYAYVLHPYKGHFHISSAEFIALMQKYPGFAGPIQFYAHWATGLLLMLIDIWGSFVVGVLFWQFMNDTTSIKQARTAYPLFGIGALFATSIGLALTTILSHHTAYYDEYLRFSVFLITCFCGCAALIQRYMYTSAPVGQDKLSMGIFETFGYVFTSRYLAYMAIMGVSFGVIIHLFERLFFNYKMAIVHIQSYIDPGIASFLVSFLGISISIFMALFSIRLMNRKNGWFKSAIVTPIMLIALSIFILIAFDSKELMTSNAMLFVMMSCMFTFIQHIKPFFFKPLMEMAYIPLPFELKVKGKAVLDLTVERFAVALGVPTFTMISIVAARWDPSMRLEIPILWVIIGLSIVYAFCAAGLSKEFKILTQDTSCSVFSCFK